MRNRYMMKNEVDHVNKIVSTSGVRMLNATLVYLICIITLFPKVIPQGPIFSVLTLSTAIFLCLYTVVKWRKLDVLDGIFISIPFFVIAVTAISGNISIGIIASSLINSLFAVFVRGELKKSNAILKAMYYLSVFIIIATFISMFFPGVGSDGHDWYFIGGKNALAIALVPALLIVAIKSYLVNGSLSVKQKLLMIIAVMSILMGGSATGAVSAILMILYLVFKPNSKLSKSMIITYPIIQIIFYSTEFITSRPIVADVVTNVFGKSLTFTHRTDVWAAAFQGVKDSLLIGHGRNNGIINAQFSTLNEAHNLTLEILLTGGIVLLTVIVWLVVIAFFTKAHSGVGKDVQGVSLFFLFIMLIIGLMESIIFQTGFWLVVAIAVSVGKIEKNALRSYGVKR